MTQIEELVGEEMACLDAQDLHRLYMEKQGTFGTLSRELQRRRQLRRLYVPSEEAPVAEAGPHQRMIVGPELGFDIYNFHVFTSGRAAGSDRYHTHGDAVKYYVAGRGFEVIGEQRFEVKVGDFIHVPANIWHGTENPYDEPLVFLAAQQFPGTFRQVPTPFVHKTGPHQAPLLEDLSEEQLSRLEPWPLYLLYLQHQMEFGRVLLEVHRRRRQNRLYVPAGEAPLLEWGPGRHLIIAPELGFDIYTFHVFMEHVPPKTEQGVPRTSGDTVKYYLSGTGVEVVEDRRFEVKAGDFLHIPRNTRHETSNPYPEPLRSLCWQQIPVTFTQVPSPFVDLDVGS